MDDEGRGQEPAQPTSPGGKKAATVAGIPFPLLLIGGLVLAAVLGRLLSGTGGGDDQPPVALSTSTTLQTTPPEETTAESEPGSGPEVPPIDACSLLTFDEVFEALLGPDQFINGLFAVSRSEGCVWTADVDEGPLEGLGVLIVPGLPDDLMPGAELDGVTAVEVADVGQAAAWFPGSEGGVLSVVEETSLGYIFVRLGIDQPDLDDAARLEAAKSLAASALPRFPGADPGEPKPIADLCELVTDEEADEVLDPHRDSHPATRDEIFVTDNFAEPVDLSEPGDATCTKLILAEIYVEIQQGDPADLEVGAEMEGVVGQPLPGLGDEAVWFAGVPRQGSFTAPHEAGVLSVRQGGGFFRVLLAVPDADVGTQDIVKGLVTKALSRLPGGSPAGVLVTDVEPTALPGFGYMDVLLGREERGEWTRGEGLVALLRVLAGELDSSEMLGETEIIERTGTGVISLAREYLTSGTDDTASTEITRLLDLLSLTPEELAGMIGDEELTALLGNDLLVDVLAQQDEQDQCQILYNTASPCLVEVRSPELEQQWPGKYVLLRPMTKVSTNWTQEDVDVALEAMKDAAETYEALGEMPPVAMYMTGEEDPGATTNVDVQDGHCSIAVHQTMQIFGEDSFQQFLARDIAYCLIAQTFPETGTTLRWWVDGLANYLSGVVYPDRNLEHVNLPLRLAVEELETSLVSRTFTNWVFFEYLHSKGGGATGVLSTIDGLPGSLNTEIAGQWHAFNEALTDVSVPDLGGGNVPYAPPEAVGAPPKVDVEIAGAGEASFRVRSFGVNRLHVQVTGGSVACVEYEQENEVKTSWRTGPPGSGSGWSGDLPQTLEGESTFLLTVTGGEGALPEGILTIRVKDVVGSADECDEEEEESSDPGDLCLEICDPSSYYRFGEQLAEWLQRLLGLLG
jgi:hypothetical protein